MSLASKLFSQKTVSTAKSKESLRAPTTQDPPGLQEFKKVVDNAAIAARDSKSIAPLTVLTDSMISVSSSLILVASKRLGKVESLLPATDEFVKKINEAFSASSKPSLNNIFGNISLKQKLSEKTVQTNQLVASNIKSMESARAMLSESNSDLSEMVSLKGSASRYDTTVIDSAKSAAISVYWKKCEIDGQISALNSYLNIVEENIIKINETVYDALLIENDINGDKSILAKSVNSGVNAQLENDRKAAKAIEDRKLFDMYMQFCNQSELGGYLAKALNCAYSSGLLISPPQTYQNVTIAGRAPSAEVMAKKFFNDLYYNFLNSYESLTPEQIHVIASLSGGAVSVDTLNIARINKLKKIVEEADKISVSASNAQNPMAKPRIARDTRNRDAVIAESVFLPLVSEEEKAKQAEAVFNANRRLFEQAALAKEAEEKSKQAEADAAKLKERLEKLELEKSAENVRAIEAALAEKSRADAETAAREIQANYEKMALELKADSDKLYAEKVAAAEAKAKSDAELAQAKYNEELKKSSEAATEKAKAEAALAIDKAARELAESRKAQEELEAKLTDALAKHAESDLQVTICAEQPPEIIDRPVEVIDSVNPSFNFIDQLPKVTDKLPDYPGSKLPPGLIDYPTQANKSEAKKQDNTLKIAAAVVVAGTIAYLVGKQRD